VRNKRRHGCTVRYRHIFQRQIPLLVIRRLIRPAEFTLAVPRSAPCAELTVRGIADVENAREKTRVDRQLVARAHDVHAVADVISTPPSSGWRAAGEEVGRI